MRIVPERSPWAQLGAVLALMVAGPWGALALAAASAPTSQVVQALAPLVFAAVLVGGLLVWMGLGIVAVVARFLWRVLRGRSPWSDAPRATECLVPPGYRTFPVLGVLGGGLLGVLTGLLTEWTLLGAGALWVSAGGAYGALLWGAAHHGFLPFPEPE